MRRGPPDCRSAAGRRDRGAVLTLTRASPSVTAGADELSAAQRAAVTSDARLVVVQGGAGAGKTEAAVARLVRLTTQLRQDPAWLLVLTTSEAKAHAFRGRLARALTAAGCREAMVDRATACVVRGSAFAGPAAAGPETPAARWPAEVADRAARVADALAPALGLVRHRGEALDLVLETMALVVSREASAGLGEAPDGDGDWFRRGVALVEEAVRGAQLETLRRLRSLEGTPGWLGDLGRQLRRPSDVGPRARDLRSALDRALRSGPDRAELGRLRALVDVATIDLGEAARREVVAAAARRRLWDASRALVDELRLGAGGRAEPWPAGSARDFVFAAIRHVIVDDAHDLATGEMEWLRGAARRASLFVTGDLRAEGHTGAPPRFRALLREAGRAVVLLEAPRFGAGVGRFVNALGARLWPSSELGGYAPTLARLDHDRSAAAPVELCLVPRRTITGADGAEHPEPIGDARSREARAVARSVRAILGGGRTADAAVLVQNGSSRDVVRVALAADGLAPDVVSVHTVEEAQGLEWSTVLVTGLDEAMGGPAPRRAWLDAETGLAVVWPTDGGDGRVWPFSSLLLAQHAAAMRDASARQRLFVAATRARTHLILSGVTRDRVAGGDTCIAPVEWLRRELGIGDLAHAPVNCRLGEAEVAVRRLEGDDVRAT